MKTCLIVDDSKVVRKFARRIIEEISFEAREACDGNEAILECEKSLPDVILLDWNMPVMNGIQFLRHLRASNGGARPKVIFCTTEHDVEHIREAFDAGTDEYLMKPFDAQMLNDKLGDFSASGLNPVGREHLV